MFGALYQTNIGVKVSKFPKNRPKNRSVKRSKLKKFEFLIKNKMNIGYLSLTYIIKRQIITNKMFITLSSNQTHR